MQDVFKLSDAIRETCFAIHRYLRSGFPFQIRKFVLSDRKEPEEIG